MIIDLILDRKDNEQSIADGHTHKLICGIPYNGVLYAGEEIVYEGEHGFTKIPLAYNATNFYQQVMDYGEVGFGITAAMDGGTEEDVKRELCKYIIDNEYNPDLCNYINERRWL